MVAPTSSVYLSTNLSLQLICSTQVAQKISYVQLVSLTKYFKRKISNCNLFFPGQISFVAARVEDICPPKWAGRCTNVQGMARNTKQKWRKYNKNFRNFTRWYEVLINRKWTSGKYNPGKGAEIYFPPRLRPFSGKKGGIFIFRPPEKNLPPKHAPTSGVCAS